MRKISDIGKRISELDLINRKVFTVLYSSAFVCLAVICVAQAGLRISPTRSFFTNVDDYEGGYFEASVMVDEPKSQVVMLHTDSVKVKDARIYVNGNEYANLVTGDNPIEITTSSVIEIYSPKAKIVADISEIGDGVVLYTPDEKVTVEKGIKVVARVGIR